MKKLLVIIGAMFICTFAIAHTINWHVGDTIIQTTTCNSGDNITPPTPPAKYGYTFSSWGAYEQLEYIESNGNQWINTGVAGECTLLLTAQGTKTLSSAQIVAGVSPNTPVTWFGQQSGRGTWGESSIPYTTKIDAIIEFKAAPVTNVINDTRYTVSYGSYYNNQTMYLFCINGMYGANVRIFKATFIQNGLTIKDLVPCRRKTDNLVGMYDTISGQFLTNKGAGNFIAGPVVGVLGAK